MPVPTIPFSLPDHPEEWMLDRARSLLDEMTLRRSCRNFSDRPVSRELIEILLAVAHSAPSGANRRPWRFVAVDDPEIKREIRIAAEEEERESYAHRMPPPWLEALEPIGTGPDKPYLEKVPWLVAVFRVNWEEVDGVRQKSYYPLESVGLACGLFLMACHQVGLATLIHTPSPMRFLTEILRSPESDRPYLLIPVGYPAEGCMVPDLDRKPLSRALQWNR